MQFPIVPILCFCFLRCIFTIKKNVEKGFEDMSRISMWMNFYKCPSFKNISAKKKNTHKERILHFSRIIESIVCLFLCSLLSFDEEHKTTTAIMTSINNGQWRCVLCERVTSDFLVIFLRIDFMSRFLLSHKDYTHMSFKIFLSPCLSINA